MKGRKAHLRNTVAWTEMWLLGTSKVVNKRPDFDVSLAGARRSIQGRTEAIGSNLLTVPRQTLWPAPCFTSISAQSYCCPETETPRLRLALVSVFV